MLYRQQLPATRPQAPWVGLRGGADQMVAARVSTAQSSHSRPAPCALLGPARQQLQSHNRIPREILGVRFPEHAGDATTEPCGCSVNGEVARGSQGCSNARSRVHSHHFPLLSALPLLITLGPAQNLCQPQQALISPESRLSYGLTAQCNVGTTQNTHHILRARNTADNLQVSPELFSKR